MSIYPCNFNDAWGPLIPPSKPSNYNKQTNELKKVMQDTTTYSPLSNQVPKPNNNINYLNNMNNTNDLNIQNDEKYVKGGNYMNKNYNTIESMNNAELMAHIQNVEKYMKEILYTLKMNKMEQLDNEYINKNKMNEMGIYIVIAIIVSYIVFKIANK